MVFSPLSLVAGFRWPLPRALAMGTAPFATAVVVVVAWQVQGIAGSPHDLVWLALVWILTWISHGAVGRRRTPATID